MAGEIIIYCIDLEEVNRELELLIRDRYSVIVEQAENIWGNYDGRIRLTAKPNRLLMRGTNSLTAKEQRKLKEGEAQEGEAAITVLEPPRVIYHNGYWWGEIVTRKTKRAAERAYRHFAEASQPHRIAMSRFLCPNCGEKEFTVWSELLAMAVKTHGVPHFFN